MAIVIILICPAVLYAAVLIINEYLPKRTDGLEFFPPILSAVVAVGVFLVPIYANVSLGWCIVYVSIINLLGLVIYWLFCHFYKTRQWGK